MVGEPEFGPDGELPDPSAFPEGDDPEPLARDPVELGALVESPPGALG